MRRADEIDETIAQPSEEYIQGLLEKNAFRSGGEGLGPERATGSRRRARAKGHGTGEGWGAIPVHVWAQLQCCTPSSPHTPLCVGGSCIPNPSPPGANKHKER